MKSVSLIHGIPQDKLNNISQRKLFERFFLDYFNNDVKEAQQIIVQTNCSLGVKPGKFKYYKTPIIGTFIENKLTLRNRINLFKQHLQELILYLFLINKSGTLLIAPEIGLLSIAKFFNAYGLINSIFGKSSWYRPKV